MLYAFSSHKSVDTKLFKNYFVSSQEIEPEITKIREPRKIAGGSRKAI